MLIFIQGRIQSPALASGEADGCPQTGFYCALLSWEDFCALTPYASGKTLYHLLLVGGNGRVFVDQAWKWAVCVLLTWLERGEWVIPCDFM